MSILDVFKKKKDMIDDGFGATPSGMPTEAFGSGFQDMNNPMAVPDQQGYPGQSQYPSYPQQASPSGSQPFSPEQMGFERVNPGGQSSSYGDSRQQGINNANIGKDFELVNAKLDAIKAELDSVNQRLKRIERMAEEPGSRKDSWQY